MVTRQKAIGRKCLLKKFKQKILLLEGWGEISFKNLIEAINKSKKISLDKFIYSLGIRYIGETNASILAYEFLSIRNLIKSIQNTDLISNVDGLGPKVVSSLQSFFSINDNKKLAVNVVIFLTIIQMFPLKLAYLDENNNKYQK